MSGRLLFVIIMYSFHKIQTQALLPPKLTATQAEITLTDSVTLNCEAPSSVSVSRCHFYIGSNVRIFSCQKTLVATELLQISNQRSPADVKVRCFYTVKYEDSDSPSPHSDTTSISVRTLLPPKLTVNPVVISETDSVTLDCQTPPSVHVLQCLIYMIKGEGKENIESSSCLRKVTGTELLLTTSQSSPAEFKVRCFYTVSGSPSPHSDTSTITIHNQTPQLSLQHFPGEHALFTCSLPGSANPDTRCNLYFGEASDLVSTTTIWSKRDPRTNQWFCQFTVTADDLLRRLRSVQQSDASCDYSLGSEPKSLSTRSDRYSLTDIKRSESRGAQTQPASTKTTGTTMTTGLKVSRSQAPTPGRHTSVKSQTFGNTDGSISTSQTPGTPTSVKTCTKLAATGDSTVTLDQTLHVPGADPTQNPPSAETWTWKLAAMAGFGVAVGVISVGLVLLCKRGTERRSYKRTPAKVTDDSTPMKHLDHGGLLPAGNGEVYNVITSVPGADFSTGSKKMNMQENRNEDSDVYHLYTTISDEPPPSALKDMMYSTVQLH
ncbi:uncharacterized protein LOC119020812 isoform X2 [Acanthopagrus latus]|uniref:uncharacterized protein LOC119020812 isoform X2 n=2 Tax=Acanthopagrus latus TaxID=8177 RepID=UPI00187C4EF8|nr:uncharacterized protein LOC119020812 isoform X2 [Acanthopagrus latus]